VSAVGASAVQLGATAIAAGLPVIEPQSVSSCCFAAPTREGAGRQLESQAAVSKSVDSRGQTKSLKGLN